MALEQVRIECDGRAFTMRLTDAKSGEPIYASRVELVYDPNIKEYVARLDLPQPIVDVIAPVEPLQGEKEMMTFEEVLSQARKQAHQLAKEFREQLQLVSQCKMRRFYLIRNQDVDPDKLSGTGIIAEGVVFEDGTVCLRWKTKHKSTAFYDNIDEVVAIHGHGGKTVLKYIDADTSQLQAK